MTAIAYALLPAAAIAVALGAASLHTARTLRREVAGLRAELSTAREDGAAALAAIPAARPAPAAETPLDDIRAAVADALAEERERELAEARAFWAAQEARDADSPSTLLPGHPAPGDDTAPGDGFDRFYLPRQADFAGLDPDVLGSEPLFGMDEVDLEPVDAPHAETVDETESAELAAARRRHPSHPDFSPHPAIGDHERTVARLEELAEDRTPLADVRPGPLGTLDVYVFADGTTVCMTPGHRETAERVAEALRDGHTTVLLGGSGVAGAYALTFAWGEGRDDSVYVLADRVIASL
ncbi:hypothetical protein AB0I82_34795 [Streptomyces sp. NPDC050315]|uniref:hypothetical protein n=1 Tax=Streptomyces sp. NPDC050315 TaxID=3155039 RepID=UPI00342AC35E